MGSKKILLLNLSKYAITPTNIEINFLKENLSSFVKKCENNRVKIGAIESKRPAVFDLIYCSDQLIKKKGIKFPINPIINIKINKLIDKFIL